MLNFDLINKIVTYITFLGFLWAFLKFIIKPFFKILIKIYNIVIIDYYAKKYLSNYTQIKTKEFIKNIKVPYNLKEDIFINNFDITCNFQFNFKEKNKLVFFFNLLEKNLPIFLVANYGMGKSTIAKFLFKYINEKTNKYSIFINLHLKQLKKYCLEIENNGIHQNIFSNEIFKEIILKNNINTFFKIDIQKLLNKFNKMLNNGDIILIFDGLDEVSISSFELDDKVSLKKSELDIFIKTIFEQNYPILLSCRKEYIPFTTIYERYKHNKHLKIELSDWNINQWNTYFKNLEKQYPLKDITSFKRNVLHGKYADLPKRPLFLAMLTELIVFNNNQDFQINDNLKTNLAEIYNKYIDFNLSNDIEQKSQEINNSIGNKKKYKEVWKKLLVELAYTEYKLNSQLSLNDIVNIAKNIDKQEKYYTQEWIEKTLESSALFAIIHRENNSDIFYFSHKSFLEYLVSYKLAEGFFIDDIDKAYCTNAWSLYQTHEVHQHFLEEITRVAYYNNIINLKNNSDLTYKALFNNKYIEKAFTKILNKYKIMQDINKYALLEYYEDFEEVLYYIGKFKIKNLKIYLFEILKNRKLYNTIYYRTVSLSLSSIENTTLYCDKYVLDIAKNYIDNKNENLFFENIKIQKKYYGSTPSILREKLSNTIENFLHNNKIESNISLIIFTYYTTFKPSNEEIKKFNQDLNLIKNTAKQTKSDYIIKICNLIPNIWTKMPNKT